MNAKKASKVIVPEQEQELIKAEQEQQEQGEIKEGELVDEQGAVIGHEHMVAVVNEEGKLTYTGFSHYAFKDPESGVTLDPLDVAKEAAKAQDFKDKALSSGTSLAVHMMMMCSKVTTEGEAEALFNAVQRVMGWGRGDGNTKTPEIWISYRSRILRAIRVGVIPYSKVSLPVYKQGGEVAEEKEYEVKAFNDLDKLTKALKPLADAKKKKEALPNPGIYYKEDGKPQFVSDKTEVPTGITPMEAKERAQRTQILMQLNKTPMIDIQLATDMAVIVQVYDKLDEDNKEQIRKKIHAIKEQFYKKVAKEDQENIKLAVNE